MATPIRAQWLQAETGMAEKAFWDEFVSKPKLSKEFS